MIAACALIALGQIGLGRDFPFQFHGAFSERGAGFYNTLAIVRPIRRTGPEDREVTSLEGKRLWRVLVDEVTVTASSRKLPPVVKIVVPVGGAMFGHREAPEKVVYPLQRGRSYLVLCYVDSQGELLLPEDSFLAAQGPPEPRSFYQLLRRDAGEVGGMAAFETRATKLWNETEDPFERLMCNVAECFRRADRAGVERTARFLELARPKGERGSIIPRVDSGAPFVRIMREAASELPPAS